ncbi:MAG: sodium:alanine symporter family protein [Bacteroidales bacterium]|nr:sodium:alanine symporter family protein [Bacteroidales bacterium]
MQEINSFLIWLDQYLGSSNAFIFLLLGTGIFFTIYLGFPQIRYFRHAIQVVSGKYDRTGAKGDTSHFQALSTALSGTIGTGNIAGVALAIYLGGPAALFWMLVTAGLGMTTKFVEVLVSHKYREIDTDGKIAGGPMYYMKKRLNIKTGKNNQIKTGYFLGGIFAVSTIFCSFGTGNLPQINSISDVLYESFGMHRMISGGILALMLGLVIIGGIKRIAKVTSRLVPGMAILYFIGAVAVLTLNYNNIIPSLISVFSNVFTGSAAAGGFLGASVSFVIQKGVGRGLFSNEAGQGSAPIAHATARANEPVSEGMVAILGPFIDTIIICMLTGLTILSSGVWTEKFENLFEPADMVILDGNYSDINKKDKNILYLYLNGKPGKNSEVKEYNDTLFISNGIVQNNVTVIHSRSVAENLTIHNNNDDSFFTGKISCNAGMPDLESVDVYFFGKSLVHSAPLTALAFQRGLFGKHGQYIVTLGLLLFAFSTAISWSYYGDRAVTYLWGTRYVTLYRIVYVIGFFIASFTNTTVVWSISAITIVLMTVPNLLGILLLHREIKSEIKDYWENLKFQPTKNK